MKYLFAITLLLSSVSAHADYSTYGQQRYDAQAPVQAPAKPTQQVAKCGCGCTLPCHCGCTETHVCNCPR